jgi:hypothetical protein
MRTFPIIDGLFVFLMPHSGQCEPMKDSGSKMVRIVGRKERSGLSKAQKLFNKLIKKIDAERKRLEAWQAMIPRYQQKYAAEFDPLKHSFDELRAEMVRLLDRAYGDKMFGKKDKAKISDIVCTIAAELMAENDNEELKQIYNRHSGGDFDSEIEEENESMKAMMEGVFGIDFGDDFDLRSPERMIARFGEKMQQKLAGEEEVQEEFSERTTRRKKSARTIAKEARAQEEAQNVSQSIRDVYRKLASALHPDKEQDLAERNRKTALMQRVNVAYGNKDLLGLLELQLEVEQIDQSEIDTISEERLKYYNKILSEQLDELLHEVSAVALSFGMRFSLSPEDVLSPDAAMRNLEYDIEDLQQETVRIKADLHSFQNFKNVKDWLRTYRIPPKSFFEDDPFLGFGFDADTLFKPSR